jgi:hypothetical protein
LAKFGHVVLTVLSIWGSNTDILRFILPGSKAIWQLYTSFAAVLQQQLKDTVLGIKGVHYISSVRHRWQYGKTTKRLRMVPTAVPVG